MGDKRLFFERLDEVFNDPDSIYTSQELGKAQEKVQETIAEVPAPKRAKTHEPEPKPAQLFDGLHFFFVPNSRVNKARDLKMRKVESLGGTVMTTWSDRVTHLIIESTFSAKPVLMYLNLKSLPAGVKVFNEHWTPDCVIFNTLLDGGTKYQVLGFDVPTAVEADESSLQIKEAVKHVTPQNTVQSIVSISPTVAFKRSDGPKDELDEAIAAIDQLGSIRLEGEDVDLDEEARETISWQRKFKCMESHPHKARQQIGPNDFIIEKVSD